MWNLYIEVIAIVTIVFIVLTILTVYVISNIHIIHLCKASNITIKNLYEIASANEPNTSVEITSEPEYIGIMLLNICMIKDNTISYKWSIITTPSIIRVESRKCILVAISPGDIAAYPLCNGSINTSSAFYVYVSPCGVSSKRPDCYPWARIYIIDGTTACAYIGQESIELARSWCVGIPYIYVWAGGLIKGVVR